MLTDLIVNILSLLTVPVNGVSLPGQNKLFEVSESLISDGKLIARAESTPNLVARALSHNEYTDLGYGVDCRGHTCLAERFTCSGAVVWNTTGTTRVSLS